MVFNNANELIDSYLNKADFLHFTDVKLPLDEWVKVYNYSIENSNNNPELYAIIANLYLYGLGVEVDYNLAKQYCGLGIEKGSINAIFTLGLMHYDGMGFPQSYENAVTYFTTASDKGLWRAQFKLAICYAVPRGVKLNHQKAFDLYLKAAMSGYAFAEANVGRYIYFSKVPYDNLSDCVKWFELAASKNVPSSMYYLGECYLKGYYVEKNLEKAFDLFYKSAELNHTSSILKVAEFYEKGMVVEQNYQIAYDYYHKCANIENPDAILKVVDYRKNQCPHCKAYFTKTTIKTIFGEKTICSACKKKY